MRPLLLRHAAILLCALHSTAALAHTMSVGFIIASDAENEGFLTATIYYGTWHAEVTTPEGSLQIRDASGEPLEGFDSVPFTFFDGEFGEDDLPLGLVAGENYFYADPYDPDALLPENTNSSNSVYGWQYATISGLSSGSYRFGYAVEPSTDVWSTENSNAINDGSFIITEDGELGGVGGTVSSISGAGSVSLDDIENDDVTPVFDGGTLAIGEAHDGQTVDVDFTVNPTNGTIDTAGHTTTFSGDFSGDGAITITGEGTIVVAGENTHGGFVIDDATLSTAGDSNLGGVGAGIEMRNGGLLHTSDSFSSDRDFNVGNGTGGFETAVGTTLTLTGGLTGDSCLIKAGSGSLNLNAAASNAIGACVQQGTLSINDLFTGQVWVDPGGTLAGIGTIDGDIEVDGRLSPGNSPGIQVVSGNVTHNAGSVLEIEIDGPTAGVGAGYHDLLQLIDGGVFTAGGRLETVLRGIPGAATNAYTPTIGDAFEVVVAEGGIVGSFDALDQPVGGLPAGTRFDAIYGTNSIVLAVTASSYGQIGSAVGLGNAGAVGVALDTIRPDAATANAGPSGQLFTGLAGLSVDQVALALQQLSGEVHAASLDTASRSADLARDAISNRLSGSDQDPGNALWGDITGFYQSVRADSEAFGHDANGYGLIIGADGQIAANTIAGLAVSATTSRTSAGAMGSGTGTHVRVDGYGRWDDGASFVNLLGGLGFDRYEAARSVALSTGTERVEGEADGYGTTLGIELGHGIDLSGARLEGIAGLSWTYQYREAFSETGSAIAALDVERFAHHTLEATLGARLSQTFVSGDTAFKPYVEAFLVQDLGNRGTAIDASLGGADFTALAADPGETAARIGLGFEALTSDTLSLSANYRGTFASGIDDHSFKLGLNVKW